MADRRRSTSAARGSSGAARRRKPAKSGPNPVILIGIVALVVVGVVFALMATGGGDSDDGSGGGGNEQAAGNGSAGSGTESSNGGGEDTSGSGGESSIFDASGGSDEGSDEPARPRVANPKTLVMKKLTDHLGHLYLSEETGARITALEADAKRFLEERWNVSKEMKAEYKKLEEAVSRESNDPFLRAVDDELNNYNEYIFKKGELHLKDDSGKLLATPFKGFAFKPYGIFVQSSKKGGEREMAEKVHHELASLSKAFTDYFGDILKENEEKERARGKYKEPEVRYPVMKVMLFQTRKDYDTYNRIKDPERDINFAMAHYEPDKQRLHVPMSGFPEHTRREVMFHEGTHQLLHYFTNKGHLGAWGAMWSDEGVAEYFGGHTRKEDGEFEFGKINSRIGSIARDNKNRKRRLSMVELLSWTRSDYSREKEENFDKATGIHLHVYSQGWALVKFLDANYNDQWREIMRRQIVSGDAGLPVFRQVFGDDFERIDEEFHAYQDKMTDDYKAKKLENGQLQ